MRTSIRTQLITLAHLSGLDNTERLLVTRFLQQRSLNERDSSCLQVMMQLHLTGKGRQQ